MSNEVPISREVAAKADSNRSRSRCRCATGNRWWFVCACMLWIAGYQTGLAADNGDNSVPAAASNDTPLNTFFHGAEGDDSVEIVAENLGGDSVVHELSVDPSGRVNYPEDRPAWIDSEATRVEGADRFVARSIPSADLDQAKEYCRIEVDALIRRYASQLNSDLDDASGLKLERDWIEEAVVRQTYTGSVRLDDGEELFEAASLIVFGEDVDSHLRRQIQQVLVRERLVGMGAVTSIGLAGLILGTMVMGMVSRRIERKSQATS